MQVQVKKAFFQSFGGINFMDATIRPLNLSSLVAAHLGQRHVQAKYDYADLLKTLFYSKAIGGEILNDLITLKEQLRDHPLSRYYRIWFSRISTTYPRTCYRKCYLSFYK